MSLPAYRCGEFHIDAANRRLTCRGVEIALEPKTFAVILQLVSRPGELVTRNELLDAIWGHRYVTPSTLNRVIVLARRVFGDDTGEPKYIQTVHGAGYRYIGPAEQDLPATVDSPMRFAPPLVARLPARIEPLIGREQELAALAELLATHRAVTVTGPGGMGKTQCALECARRLASQYPDGVWFFDLAPLETGEDWLRALAAAVAMPTAEATQLLQKLLPLLNERRALLLLDNCDRIAAGVGSVVFEILRGTGSLKFLATSQTPLNFLGERLMRLPALALPAEAAGRTEDLTAVKDAPAVEMLVTRIRAAQPAFALNSANAGTIVEICRRLDGMPLALELAAARFALLSPEQVLERLDHRFRFLSSDVWGRDPRHRNLLVLLEWSFALLSPEEQQLLSWLSVFVQGWSVEATIGLAGPLGRDPEMTVELMSGLVNKSLVSVDPNFDPPRYRLLESVREFALERLRASAEEQRAREAHLAFVVHMCRSAYADMTGGRMSERVGKLLHEHGNIGSAVDYSVSTDGRASALAIVGSLTLYVKARGIYDIGPQWGRRALEATGDLHTTERARTLLCVGVALVHLQDNTVSPQPYLAEACRLARQHGDAWTEAYACGYLALWLANWNRGSEARQQADVAQSIASRLLDPLLLGLAGLADGWVHIARGDCPAAIRSLGSVRDLGDDVHQRHFIDMYIGLALFTLGQNAAAAGTWSMALRGAATVANIRGVAGSIEGCGYIAERLGYDREAVRLLAAAQAIRDRTGVPLFRFWMPHNEAARARLSATLGAVEYGRCWATGSAMREEDAANEARTRLQGFSADAVELPKDNGPASPPS